MRPPQPSPLSNPRYSNCSRNFHCCCGPAPPLANLSTEWSITSKQAAPPQFLPTLGDWIRTNTASPRKKAGIFCQSNSPWASPLHLVPKKDGSRHPCGDYCHLNAVTVPDRCPLPNMQSLYDRMAENTMFSKIYLVKAYHQIPIAGEDIPKTTKPHLLASGNLVSETLPRPFRASTTIF
jgi:hypothetical protein